MPRAETDELMNQDDTTQANPPSCELENILEDLLSFNKGEFESSPLETSVKNGFLEPQTTLEGYEEKEFLDNKTNGYQKVVSLKNNQHKDGEVNAVNENSLPHEESSKQHPLSWRERSTLKIRYTRQYLLDRRFEPDSTAFPDCLLEYLKTRDVPLKEEENRCYDQKSMDHILFYTSLPYTRRKPFNQCYF